MHYCCLIITKEFPTDEVLSEVLAPYNWEETEEGEYPPFTWDWWQVGGRYNGMLKLTINENDEKYRWEYYAREPRKDTLFRSYLLDKMSGFAGRSFMYREEDYYPSMGSRDDFLYVDGALIEDIKNLSEVTCYCCVDKDGKAYSTESWDGKEWIKNDKFDTQFAEVLADSKGCYVCIVDLHD